MIIELQMYHAQDGRQYCSPLGGTISAVDRVRIDCVECSYTKVKVDGGESPQDALPKYFHKAPEIIDHLPVEGLQWYEAILVQYRCSQEVQQRCLVAIGYTLMLYGAEDRPTRLEALLGPATQSATKLATKLATKDSHEQHHSK